MEMIHYGVTKTAQIALARGLAETTRGTDVTVNSVLPGPTLSEGISTFIENLAKEQNAAKKDVEEQFFERMRPTSLIQRFADTRDLNVIDVVPVPDRLENAVGKPESEDVLNRLLAEVVIDAKNLGFIEELAEAAI